MDKARQGNSLYDYIYPGKKYGTWTCPLEETHLKSTEHSLASSMQIHQSCRIPIGSLRFFASHARTQLLKVSIFHLTVARYRHSEHLFNFHAKCWSVPALESRGEKAWPRIRKLNGEEWAALSSPMIHDESRLQNYSTSQRMPFTTVISALDIFCGLIVKYQEGSTAHSHTWSLGVGTPDMITSKNAQGALHTKQQNPWQFSPAFAMELRRSRSWDM